MASIEKRGDNTYKIVVSDGYDINGKKIRYPKTIKLDPNLTPKQVEKELQRLAVLFEEEVSKGLYLDGSKITFAEFTDRWREDYAIKQLAPKTLFRYEGLLKRILPAIGHIRLDKLQPPHLIKFYNNLSESGLREDGSYIAKSELEKIIKTQKITLAQLAEKAGINKRTVDSILSGNPTKNADSICKALNIKLKDAFVPKQRTETLSNRTIQHHHRLISSILTCAVQWQLIPSNPAARVKPPKVEPTEAEHYDEETVERILSLLDNEPIKYKAMIYLTMFAGCRLGELSGFEWDDIDFEHNLTRIRQASQYIPGKGTFTKSPKNEGSKRIISMPPMVMEVLKEYKTWQNERRLELGDQWTDNRESENDEPRNFVFTQWNGKPIYPTTPSNWFRKFRKKYNLPELKFHGLRHTNASILIGQGIDIQTIAKRLGHTKATTTTSIYSHFLKKPDEEAAQKLENLFNKNKENELKQA